MSKASEVRRRRAIRRRVGTKRGTRLGRFFAAIQRRCFATIESAMTGKAIPSPSADFVMMLEQPYPPEFLKLRMSDLAVLGAKVELRAQSDIHFGIFDAEQRLDEAKEEERLIEELLNSKDPVRLDDLKRRV